MAEYYSVEAFLSDNARCPCKFLHTVPNLGYLANQHDKHLQDKTVVELPFWLGLDLARMEGREFLALGLPKAFSSRVRNALAASSKAVNLRSLSGGSFYGAGVKLDDAIEDDTLKKILYKTFTDRLEEVFDQAQHASSAPGVNDVKLSVSAAHQQPIDDRAADFVAGMDEWEKERECLRLARDVGIDAMRCKVFVAAEGAAKASLNWAGFKRG